MKRTNLGWLRSATWFLLLAVILLTSVAAVTRSLDVLGLADFEDPEAAIHLRYRRHPQLSLLHIVPGTICLVIGPLQLAYRIRARYLRLHRWMGRIYVVAGVVAAVSSMVIAYVFPAVGGIATQTATYLFGTLLLLSLSMAVHDVQRGDIVQHRQWVMRSFALMLGAASVRLTALAFMFATGRGFLEVFATSFWLGFTLNLVVAEMWIQRTRARDTSTWQRRRRWSDALTTTPGAQPGSPS